jgi:hypothetical protein
MDKDTVNAILIAALATATGMILYDVLKPKIEKMLNGDEDFERV